MKFLKALLVGALGSLVMSIVMGFNLHVTGIAPFNVSPPAAFLMSLGIPPMPLALVIHFGYGALGSAVLFAIFRDDTDWAKGLGLAVFLWAVMMTVYSPIIGWGMFGYGASSVPPGDPLHLESGIKYPGMTLLLHLIYGMIIGRLNPL